MKQLRYGWLGLLGFGLALIVSGCDYSNDGLGAPAVDRGEAGSGAAGRGGSSGRGGTSSSGAASSGGAGGSMTPMGMLPPMEPPPPPPPPPVDAAAPDGSPAGVDGSSGIKTIDAMVAVDTTPVTPPPMPASVCPTDGALVLCLDFEGVVRDQSEPSAPVTVRGVSFEAGPSGQAGRLGGSSQIALSSGAGLGGGPFTIEAWLRPDGLPTGMQRLGVMDKQNHFGLFVLPGGDVVCYSQGAMATASGAARAGQWISAACTVGGGNVGVWINGVRRAQAPQATPSTPPDQAVAVGSNSPTGDAFHGLLDNVRIWTGARSAAEICQLAYGCN